jgi:hypothetical protein
MRHTRCIEEMKKTKQKKKKKEYREEGKNVKKKVLRQGQISIQKVYIFALGV